jgi:hypothetical protein
LSQRHAIQVQLEDPLLVEVRLEPPGPQDLAHLAGGAARRAAQQARQLHRDRGAARDDSAGSNIVPQRAGECAHFHAPVVVEPAILHCDERLQHLGIDLAERDESAARAVGRPRRAQQHAGAVEQGDGRNGPGVGERGWEGRSDPERERGGDAGRERQCDAQEADAP